MARKLFRIEVQGGIIGTGFKHFLAKHSDFSRFYQTASRTATWPTERVPKHIVHHEKPSAPYRAFSTSRQMDHMRDFFQKRF